MLNPERYSSYLRFDVYRKIFKLVLATSNFLLRVRSNRNYLTSSSLM